ncbi:MAG: hypothetical protein ACRD96_17190, partial [Bryobacteraceae bacterium]
MKGNVPVPAVRTLAATVNSSPVHQLGFALLLLFVFVSYSRILEHSALNHLRLPFITSLLVLGATVVCGGVPRAFRSPAGKLLMAFSIWMLICVPFSVWRRGSFTMLLDEWLKSLMCYVMMAGLVVTVKQARQVMFTLAAASVTVTLVALAFNYRQEGRLAMPGGTLGNPNDLAQIVLLGLPFVGMLATSRGDMLKKALALAAVVVMLIAIVLC